MKDHELIARLGELRRIRVRRAEEKVAHRQAAMQQAARRTEEATAATAAHQERAAAEEQALLESFLGRAVSLAELDRIRQGVLAATEEETRLREETAAARAAEECRGKELAQARQRHARRVRAAAKLEHALEHVGSHAGRRRAALAELAEEEDFGSGRRAAVQTEG